MIESARKKIGIIFGGKSREHEISILSAASVMAAIDCEKYETLPFAIDKNGAWYFVDCDLDGLSELTDSRVTSLFDGARRVSVADFDAATDFAFPLLHGPYGEDGTIQGLFEMLGKPYAGSGVASSAISMDKIFAKELWIRAGLPVCEHTQTTKYMCADGIASEGARIERELAYPIFVKPANMGSSVGVSKAGNRAELETAIALALRYDRRVIAEQAVVGRELEVGVLGNETPNVSAIGEILSDAEYYDYDSKYKGDGARLAIPADIPARVRDEIEQLAVRAYRALDGEGFARIDLFYDERTSRVLFSEMNTIPGFTRYSMFPLLWDEKGVSYAALIEEIIRLGYERHYAANHR